MMRSEIAQAASARKAPTEAASSTRGILIVLVAWFLFACMDAGSKQLAAEYSIVQIL